MSAMQFGKDVLACMPPKESSKNRGNPPAEDTEQYAGKDIKRPV